MRLLQSRVEQMNSVHGQQLCTFTVSWQRNDFKADGLNFGLVDIPAFADAGQDSVSILSTSGISMSKDSKNKKSSMGIC